MSSLEKILILVVSITVSINLANSSKILIAHPSPSRSHVLGVQAIAKILAENGHEVTHITTFPPTKHIKNYRVIDVPSDGSEMDIIKEMIKKPGRFSGSAMFQFPKMLSKIGNDTLQSPEVRKLMDEGEFDLLIVGYFFSEYLLGLGDHFKCPTILISPHGMMTPLASMVGNPLGIPASPHIALLLGNDFFSRLATLMMYSFDIMFGKILFQPSSREVYDYNFPSDRYRSYEESLKNVSLLLLNTHFSSTQPRPYLPNVIEVGGLQVKPTPSPLPVDLKKFLDEAEHGAILFSFGSNVKSNFLSQETLTTVLKVFSKIKQKVVMKWESDVLEGKPENVFISKWLPQDDVLAHKNLKAFISHCGYGGVIEAKYHGVPIIGIPIFGDQPTNADIIVKEGWGIRIDLLDLTEELLFNGINDVITNSSYSQVAQKLSKLSKDRTMNAQQTAIYWIEYIIRHNGAPHLHYPGADLNFFQDNSLDLIAFIVIAIYVIYKILKIIIVALCRKCCCRRRAKKQKTQ